MLSMATVFMLFLVPQSLLAADKHKSVAVTEMSLAVTGGCQSSCMTFPTPSCVTLHTPLAATDSIVAPHVSHIASRVTTDNFSLLPAVSSVI